MKSQNQRGGKRSSFSGSAPGTHQSGSVSRRNSLKLGNANSLIAAATESQNKMIDLLANATGKSVVSTVSSGAKYKGTLLSLNIGISGEDALSIVLLKPVLVSKPLLNEKGNIDQKSPPKLVIEAKDLIDIELELAHPFPAETPEIRAKIQELVANTQTETTTETTIPPEAKNVSLAFKTDRDISAGFTFSERELQRWVPDANTPELSLEGGSGGAWDQFKVNEERFGVESSYDEHLYTTKINTQAEDYKDRLVRAEKLAKEIEGLTTSDNHVLEERGMVVDDSGMDEEDKYSGVIQDKPVDNRGNELMAALRNARISRESVAMPAKDGKYTTPRQRAAQYHGDPAIILSSATRKAEDPACPVLGKNTAVAAISVHQGPASIPPKPQFPEPQPQQQAGEAFRLNAQSEFNALREFSANFKIPHKIPNDLLPILSKDKIKQDEILRKQETGKNGVKPVESAEPSVVEPAQSAKESPAIVKNDVPAVEPKREASKFKLNPNAAAFTPSKPQQVSPIPLKVNFNRSPSTASLRMHTQRPFSGSLAGSGIRRHYQISAADFFGGPEKVPMPETQKQKAELFRKSFNMFATAVRKHDKNTPLVLEKAFKTPPTWDSTVDISYDMLIAKNSAPKGPHMMSPGPSPHFMASPMMAMPNAVPPMMAGGYMGGAAAAANGGKFSMSPHLQQPMAAQFQQPFRPLMMYPQFQGGVVPPGQPQMMYALPGVDPLLLPPGAFMVPGYIGSPNPMNAGGAFQGMYPQSHHSGQGSGHHQGGRRYNQGKRVSNASDR